MTSQDPVEAARAELVSLLASNMGVTSPRVKQAANHLAALEKGSTPVDLEKQLRATKKDLDQCKEQIDRMMRILYSQSPRTPGALSEWLKALELPPGVDPQAFANTMSYEYMMLVERVARSYISAWQSRQKALSREVLTLQSRVDYTPYAPLVEILVKPIEGKEDVKRLQMVLKKLSDAKLKGEVERFRPDLSSLIDSAKARLTDYLVLEG